MLTRLQVSNYRSLGDSIDLELGSLVVLVGRNGAGKSNVVDVPRFIAHALRDGLDAAITDRGNMRHVGRWSGGRRFDIHIRIHAARDDQAGFFDVRIGSQGGGDGYRVLREEASWTTGAGDTSSYVVEKEDWVGPEGLSPQIDSQGLALSLVSADARFKALHDELRSVAVYSIFPAVLRSPQRYDGSTPMLDHGENWATALRAVVKDKSAKAELRAALKEIVGDIDDVRVSSVAGFLSPQFRHDKPPELASKKDKWFDAGQESDGTLRVAGILTAILQSPLPGLLAIEEPELTVHPGAIPVIYDYLREAASSAQVVITTHSTELLDRVDPDAVRVVERRDGVTRISALGVHQLEVVREHLAGVGELLRVEGLSAAE